MRSLPPIPLAAAVLALGLPLGACGSATKTVSVSGAPPSTAGESARTASTPAQGGAGKSSSNGAPSTTRSAPAPAFVESERHTEGLSAAAQVLRTRGFTPTNTTDFHAHQALEVLIGMHIGSGDGYGQQAFFFVNNRYIGTDAARPSATLRVVSQSDTEATLAYPLYRNGDALCCPGGGQAKVRFQLNNGKLTALDPIPALQRSKGALARY